MKNEEERVLINKKAYGSIGKLLISSVLELSLSLSLEHLEFSQNTLEDYGILGISSKKAKEKQESARGHRDQQLHCILFAGTELHV